MTDEIGKAEIFKLTGEILTAHVANNAVPAGDLARLIGSVHQALSEAANPPQYEEIEEEQAAHEPTFAEVFEREPLRIPAPPPGALAAEDTPEPQPMVPIEESIRPESLTCLECGRELQMLRAHLGAKHGLTFEEYKRKWRLPKKYPKIAADYSKMRSDMSRERGLGRKGGMAAAANRLAKAGTPPPPEPEPVAAPLTPAVPIEKSVRHEQIICLECGHGYRVLALHVRNSHAMTADEYKRKWNLPRDYPMTAPQQSEFFSEAAKAQGLGKTIKGSRTKPEPEDGPTPEELSFAPPPGGWAKEPPAVPIEDSLKHDQLTCLDCGQEMRVLKLHLRTVHKLTPEWYRAKWGLPADYPMSAPAVTEFYSARAKAKGMGTTIQRPKPNPLELTDIVKPTRAALVGGANG